MLRIKELSDQGTILVNRYNDAKGSTKRSLNIQIKTLKKRLAALTGRLKSRIIGEIIDVTYLYNNHTLHGQFVNLPDEEIREYYSTLAKVRKVDIQIVEIKRRKTFISDVPLD